MRLFERRCAYCGEKIFNAHPKQKYHKNCSRIVNLERTKEYNRQIKSGERVAKIKQKRDKYNKDMNAIKGYRRIAISIVVQAIEDWRSLCNDETIKEGNVNFTELEQFFKNECDTYLVGTTFTGESILKELQKERVKSGH